MKNGGLENERALDTTTNRIKTGQNLKIWQTSVQKSNKN